jgi:AAA15 family ATPase/GTPase
MITNITVDSFKSLEAVEVELGQVNVFIGANGSGKSNLLEALGVLSAAAEGKVNDQVLLQRGVRPGVPMLYKSSFKARSERVGGRNSPHIFFGSSREFVGDVGHETMD